MNMLRINNQRGLTLVELVVAIVVVSVAVGGVLMVMNYTVLHSADPVLRHQAIAIAEAYMEEITLKAYLDPDDGTLCPANEGSRNQFDNVCDYNGLADTGAVDQDGNSIGNLGNYDVAVTVVADTFGSPSANGLRIDVTVTDPANETISLTGYRAPY